MKLSKKYFMIFILFFLLNIFFMPSNNKYYNMIEPIEYFDRVKNTEYHDWSEAKILNQDYSFSTIYLTEKTEFEIFKNDGKLTWIKTDSGKELPQIKSIGKNGELVMLITNSAVNKDGEVLDVLIKINNVTSYQSGGSVNALISKSFSFAKSQNSPTVGKTMNLDVGDPILFELKTTYACCDFTMIYYKSGTYNYSSDSGQLGNINLVNGFFGDIDAPETSQNQFLNGKEGMRPNVGSSIIYYNKKGRQPTNSTYQDTYLQEIDNGIAAKSRPNNTDVVWYATSALILTGDISDSAYSFTYGGYSCHMIFHFSSPYPYDVVAPIKKVSEKEVRPGQEFTYDIIQYIPNNYYANLFNFSELYNNLYSNSRFTEVTIKDSFDKNLEINKDRITITNEIEEEVTEKFDISISDNNLVITSKDDNFNDSTFYSHTYTVHVPVSLKKDTKGIANIKNTAVTTSKIGDEEEKDLTSNEVIVDIIYKLIVNYLKEGTNDSVAESKTFDYKLNDNYITDYPTINKLELVGIPNNANGTIIGDTVVNYYYRESLIENPNTGPKTKFIIALTMLFLSLMFYFKKNHKKLYKI